MSGERPSREMLRKALEEYRATRKQYGEVNTFGKINLASWWWDVRYSRDFAQVVEYVLDHNLWPEVEPGSSSGTGGRDGE